MSVLRSFVTLRYFLYVTFVTLHPSVPSLLPPSVHAFVRSFDKVNIVSSVKFYFAEYIEPYLN